MATKYFCDGCDDEIREYDSEKHHFTVNVQSHSTTISGGGYDLCSGCGRHIKDAANPRTWPRAVRCEPARRSA